MPLLAVPQKIVPHSGNQVNGKCGASYREVKSYQQRYDTTTTPYHTVKVKHTNNAKTRLRHNTIRYRTCSPEQEKKRGKKRGKLTRKRKRRKKNSVHHAPIATGLHTHNGCPRLIFGGETGRGKRKKRSRSTYPSPPTPSYHSRPDKKKTREKGNPATFRRRKCSIGNVS